MKSLVTLLTCLCLAVSLIAQEWEAGTVGDIAFEFPKPFREISTSSASGFTYNQDNVYITLTSVPDTTGMNPETRLERSRYYAATAASVTFKLRGKMVENQDSMVGERHFYYTSVEVAMPDSATSRYDLLQYMYQDTLHGFSCQYIVGDKEGEKLRDTFFERIRLKESGVKVSVLLPVILGGSIIVFVVALIGLRKKLSN